MKEYNRLTTKGEVGIGLSETSGNIVNDFEKVVNRLVELEDFLEQTGDDLGIDLITLFKALKDGFHVKQADINEGCISLVKAKDIRFIDILTCVIVFVETKVVFFKDYGNTWALTEEELERKANES